MPDLWAWWLEWRTGICRFKLSQVRGDLESQSPTFWMNAGACFFFWHLMPTSHVFLPSYNFGTNAHLRYAGMEQTTSLDRVKPTAHAH